MTRIHAAGFVNRILLVGFVWIWIDWVPALLTFVVAQFAGRMLANNMYRQEIEDMKEEHDRTCDHDHSQD